MVKATADTTTRPVPKSLRRPDSYLALEITGKCPLECAHCYNESGPTGTHGAMGATDWVRVIDEAVAGGIAMVQFIGGEPTTHPAFEQLVRCAIKAGLAVEVFSNLVRVKCEWWELFAHPKVSLATSYYSDQPTEHDQVTGRRGSHARTRANIIEVTRRRIPLRVEIVDILPGQRVDDARADLAAIGVTRVRINRRRRVGRAALTTPQISDLCGRCGIGTAAIYPSGQVSPCLMARWMIAGNVRHQSLNEIMDGETMQGLVSAISKQKAATMICPPQTDGCSPFNTCGPDYCSPETGGR